jgi:hypothetical protein
LTAQIASVYLLLEDMSQEQPLCKLAVPSSLCQPFAIALPAIVGFVAGRFGLLASLIVLGSAPVFFLLLAPRSEQSSHSM